MKALRRYLIVRRLRAVKREMDYVYEIRRATVRRESALKLKGDFLSNQLMQLEIGRRA